LSHIYNASLILSRRSLLQAAASCAAYSLLPGCGLSDNPNSPSAPANPPPAPFGSIVQGALTVTTTSIGTIPPRFIGLSYEKLAMTYGYFHPSNHNLIAMFQRLGAGVLRIGGGSVDLLLWTPNNTGTHMQITSSNIKDLAGFLAATGWQCLYGVNLATSTPASTAAEAGFAAAALGSSLLGIELGNEPDEYGVAGNFFAGNWTFPQFLSRWYLFRSAILQAAPHVPITGPATGGGNHISTWTLPFGQAVTPSELTLLTQHYYRANGASPTSTGSFLVSPDTQLTADLTTLHAGALQLGLPYRISECNSFYNGGAASVSDSYASSLWVIDFLLSAALGGAVGVNMHGGGNGPGYTPIADDSGGVIEARPEYYGLLLFTLAGPGTLLQTQLSAGTLNVTAYAVKKTSGGLSLIVVNKDPLENLTLSIQTSQTIRTATMQTMTGASLAATSGVTIQGALVNQNGSFAPLSPTTLTPSATGTTCHISALSAALISIT
jgi:hypothetical protein